MPLSASWRKSFTLESYKTQLNDRQVRVHRLEKFLQRGSIQLQLDSIEVVERIAKMHQHQVALMPQHGVNSALSRFFRTGERSGSLAGYLLLARCSELAPLRPAEAEHLMQHTQSLKRERNRVQLGLRFSRVIGSHQNSSFQLCGRFDHCKREVHGCPGSRAVRDPGSTTTALASVRMTRSSLLPTTYRESRDIGHPI